VAWARWLPCRALGVLKMEDEAASTRTASPAIDRIRPISAQKKATDIAPERSYRPALLDTTRSRARQWVKVQGWGQDAEARRSRGGRRALLGRNREAEF